jgi:hypothetical protein
MERELITQYEAWPDEIVAGLNPPECIIRRKTRLMGLDDHAGIDRGHRCTSQFQPLDPFPFAA